MKSRYLSTNKPTVTMGMGGMVPRMAPTAQIQRPKPTPAPAPTPPVQNSQESLSTQPYDNDAIPEKITQPLPEPIQHVEPPVMPEPEKPSKKRTTKRKKPTSPVVLEEDLPSREPTSTIEFQVIDTPRPQNHKVTIGHLARYNKHGTRTKSYMNQKASKEKRKSKSDSDDEEARPSHKRSLGNLDDIDREFADFLGENTEDVEPPAKQPRLMENDEDDFEEADMLDQFDLNGELDTGVDLGADIHISAEEARALTKHGSGPSFRVNEDGTAVMDDSAHISQTPQTFDYSGRTRITEHGNNVRYTQGTHSKRAKLSKDSGGRIPATPKRWSDEDTELFYDAIRQVGGDLGMVSRFFPGRTRKDIVNKYKREEKMNPRLMDNALFGTTHQVPLNLDKFLAASEEKDKQEGVVRKVVEPQDENDPIREYLEGNVNVQASESSAAPPQESESALQEDYENWDFDNITMDALDVPRANTGPQVIDEGEYDNMPTGERLQYPTEDDTDVDNAQLDEAEGEDMYDEFEHY